ncbi:arsenate reductase ArsC [Tahibacter caeni]|uniref:arsenate reductase ArsC n=1 Tax=Tahibacter caeni TaxID=1453545 RepID=UPI00214922A5|nr:arsenate reductase ArsC [Tahibacter caeni]
MNTVATHHPLRVLFLCTGNSARSILCEATLRHWGAGRFEVYSAGSRPAGRVHPDALAQLQRTGIATDGLASKSWDRFAAEGATPVDLVITVCHSAAQEPCPVFFGNFVRAHWGLPDPSHAPGDAADVARAFADTHALITARVRALAAAPVETMDAEALRAAVDAIAEQYPIPAGAAR